MKTFNSVQVKLVRVGIVGILMSVAGCSLDASGKGSARQRSSQRDPSNLAPSGASNDEPAARASREPASIARVGRRSPQDPTAPRPSTKEACDACQGIWAVHGIEAEEVCICQTDDEGRDCVDGKDCQGECLLDVDAEFHVMDQSDPPRGYYRGHCAGYDTTFGCFRHIADDIEGQIPLTAEEAGEEVCVD